MKRSAAVLGVSAFALSVAAIPVAAAVIGDDVPATAAVAESPSESVQAFDRAGTYSDASLAGTGAVFLLLGVGTVGVAHRRRWRMIDMRETSVDVRDGAAKPARA